MILTLEVDLVVDDGVDPATAEHMVRLALRERFRDSFRVDLAGVAVVRERA